MRVAVSEAKALEDQFISRFEETFDWVINIEDQRTGEFFPAGRADRELVRRNRSSHVIGVMKRLRVFDRGLLERVPLDEMLEYRIFVRRFLGRRRIRIVVAACVRSPLEQLVEHEEADEPLGPLQVEEVVSVLGTDPDVYYYLGILSTTGWAPGIEGRLPTSPNLSLLLVENMGGTRWRQIGIGDGWGELRRVFDPETDEEKVARVVRAIQEDPYLSTRGGHLVVDGLAVEHGIGPDIVTLAVEQMITRDRDLSLQQAAGRNILKRRSL